MTVGRRPYPYQDPNGSNSLAYFAMMQSQSAGKPGNSSMYDEQTVPQALYQPENKANSYKEQWQPDYSKNVTYNPYNQLYNSADYSLDHNFYAYPMYQPNYTDVQPAVQGNDTAEVLRQHSIPHGSLDQFLDNSGFDYDQVLENLDLTQYGNADSFSLEDYADLEQVNNNVNFDDVTVKQEKSDKVDGKNLEEMETVINNNMMNTNYEWQPMVNYGNNVTINTESSVNNSSGNVVNTANDQSLDEQNLIEILDGFYASPHSVEWQNQYNYPLTNPPFDVSKEFVVKTEPNDNDTCDFLLAGTTQNNDGQVSLGIPDEELIQMPVSRFNELLSTLTVEQSNLAKDIRRRGKNKQAARLCRKRKLDNITALEDNLTQMQDEKSKLLEERKQIIAETKELKSQINCICEMLVKGLSEHSTADSSKLSVLHHSNGQTVVFEK